MAVFFQKRQDEQVHHLCQRLADAVEVILNPNSSRDKRMEATRMCEEFKDNSIYLTSCGIHLYSSHPNFIVKHFGLQLIQHAVKFNWNEMAPEEKENLKLLSLDFIQGYAGSLLDDPSYLKDGIAKFTVEIMKREWPQQWPDAIKNLSEISQKGHSQLFTVLRTLLCLAEEATNMDGYLPQMRRKEIFSSLCAILEELFKFFVATLQRSSEKMKELKAKPGDVKHKEVLLQKLLAESVLTTLCGYVEWVNIKFLVQENAILLQTLCLLLQEDDLRLPAAECLEAIAGRKGPTIDREPILILFSLDAISLIFASVNRNIFETFDDEKYILLKRICTILCLLGQTQLASLWGNVGCPNVDEPSHFHIYLTALITLHQHKNMLTSDMINRTWKVFLRNSPISKNPTFCSFIPKILEIAKAKMSRTLHPVLNSSAVLYPDADFGSMAEKYSAWTTLRASTKDIVQEITSLYPSDAFLHTATWLLKLTNTASPTTQVTDTSPEYLEWECFFSFASSVLNKLFSNDPSYIQELMGWQVRMGNSTITVNELSKKCIESLVQYETKALLIQNLIVMCFEPFIPFLHFHYELLLIVIHKIFGVVTYQSPDHDDPKSEIKAYEYRRAAGSVWIRLCLSHKDVLIKIIEDLTKHIQTSYEADDTSTEKSLLAEGLVVLSNGYGNFEKQSKYLNDLIAPTKRIWMNAEVERALSSPELFISFIGLDNPDADNYQVQKQRQLLIMCVHVIDAVLKRVEIPKDPQKQVNGGFKTRLEEEPANPGACAVLPMLSNLFHLFRVLSSIWNPSVRVKIPHYYQPALDMHEAEKAAIFGLDGRDEGVKKQKVDKDKRTNLDHMKTYLFKLNELCALALSDCSRLEEGYFNAPLLGQHLVTYVIEPWKHLPNYRLRNFIRSSFKMFCRVCPPAYYESAVVPVMVEVLTFMIEHLNKEWEVVRNREIVRPHLVNIEDAEIDEEEEADKDTEVAEDQLVHLLTKNFLESFFAICTMKRPSVQANLKNFLTEEPPMPDNSDNILEELPKFLLKHPATCKVFLFVPFMALQWPDTAGFVKAAKLCVPFLKQVVQNPPTGVAMAPEMFEQILTLALKGLQIMGHQGEIQAQLVKNAFIIYDTLRPLFPSLKNIILQVPNVDAAVLNEYDLNLLAGNDMSEKQKKKIFKGLLSGLIGKEIGKMFQNDITILNLPAMPVVKKESPSSLLDTADSNDLGLIRLFEPTLRAGTT